MAAETRARMIDAALVALQQRGVAGMSFTDVLDASGAARGAIYHHFPGGKTQLITEAANCNALDVRTALAALPATDPHAVVEAFLTTIRPTVEASATGTGCAIAALATTPDPDDLRQVAATTFTSWTETLADRLTDAGFPQTDANALATTLIALLEGTLILCRATASTAPFDQITPTIATLIQSQYPQT